VGILFFVILYAPHLLRLAARLGCPRCNSKKLTKTNANLLKCEKCNYTFSIGPTKEKKAKQDQD
jgi:ribosomal protein L37AE/L43A